MCDDVEGRKPISAIEITCSVVGYHDTEAYKKKLL